MARSFPLVACTTAALCSANHLPGERDFSIYTYEDYVKEFKHTDLLSEEQHRTERKGIFEGNLELIRKHNADPSKTSFATVNEYTDLRIDEFRALRIASSPPPVAFQSGDAFSTEFRLEELPDSVDWRDVDGVVTPVKNQGHCGSCWAFSATEELESFYAIATSEAAPILSPQQVNACTPNPRHCGGTGGCHGATSPIAFNYTKGVGVTTEANYPYTGGQGVTGVCDPAKIQPAVINSGFVSLATNDYTALITAVATVGPIATSVAAGGEGWKTYGGGVYSGGLEGCDFVQDHAVQLVGYGIDGSELYWQVRNSWGASWGEAGYIRLRRYGEGLEPCGVDKEVADGSACEGDYSPVEYCGMCAILSSSSYPTGVTRAPHAAITV